VVDVQVVQGAPAARSSAAAAENACVLTHRRRTGIAGGLACCSGEMVPQMGDAEDAMVVAVAAVTVGH
jgi:hypothetical protein